MDEKRFKFIKQKGTMTSSPMIVVDNETGVNYLFVGSGYAGGLSPLLDRNGKPIITKVDSVSAAEDILTK